MTLTKENKRKALMDATMQVVAENGLDNFSMKRVTQKVGVSEALIYRHFSTKENLLYLCFEEIHKSIATIFSDMKLPDRLEGQFLFAFLHDVWMKYFRFLVQGGYRTIFYFEYRDSSYVREVKAHDDEAKNTYFKDFAAFFYYLDNNLGVLKKTTSEHLWTFVLDTTGIFAKRIIRGELPDTVESRENVWLLVSEGLSGLMPKNF